MLFSSTHMLCSHQVASPVQATLECSNSYDTRNVKSLRHYTRDALPRADHYRNVLSLHGQLCRPTLDELHGGQGTLAHEAAVSAVIAVPRLLTPAAASLLLLRASKRLHPPQAQRSV